MRLRLRSATSRWVRSGTRAASPRTTRFFIGLGLALVAAIAGGTALTLAQLRSKALGDSERELRSLAFVISQETDRSFQSLELVESNLIERMRGERFGSEEDYRRRMSGKAVHEELSKAINGLPQVDRIALIDDHGKLVNFSLTWPPPDVDLSDRDYFQALSHSPGTDSFLSVPVKARTTGTWSVYLVRRVSGPNGEFLGLVLGAMQLSYFENFYRSIALGDSSSISLFRRDGILLARHPHIDPSIGRSLLIDSKFQLLLDHVDQGSIRVLSAIDGQQRLLAAHSVAHFPLIVVAGTTVEAALAGWKQQALSLGLIVGLAILVIALSLCVAAVMVARQLQSQALVAVADAEKAAALRAQAKAEAEHEAERQRIALERQLQQFHKMEALGTLAGGVAHDLNNTLVPIIALTKLAAGRLPEQSRERQNLGMVLQAAERARDLVRQILAFSREETIEKHAIDVVDPVRNAITMLRAILPTTVRIATQIQPAPQILADPGQIHQIVVNLMTNAAHAIGAEMGTITVVLGTAPGDGCDWVSLAVADTGCGMNDATRHRIFEPFFTTKAVGEGTGLGLAVVHGIVTDHGGRIAVESAIDKGTRFEVLLPPAPQGEGAASEQAELVTS
jgi:signal transduction histidine kinase